MKAVVLAGGLGVRLKPFTEVIPKPLLPIGEKAVLEIQIDRLRRFGFDDIVLATNYRSAYIERFLGDGSRYGVHLTISKEETPLGTAGPLRLLKDHLTEPFLVLNGDILTLADFSMFYRFALETDSLLTLAVKKLAMPYDFGKITFEGNYVTAIEEKSPIIMYAVAGMYVMKPKLLDRIPEGVYYGMDVLMKAMLKDGIPIAKYEFDEYWLDIGRMDDYEEAQKVYETHFRDDLKP